MSDPEQTLLDLLHRHLQSIWDGDAEAYSATTAADVSFFEWYISPQRIDGLDFHLREIRVHAGVLAGNESRNPVSGRNRVSASAEFTGGEGQRIEHEILQPRVQIYGDTAIITYTLLLRVETRFLAETGSLRVSHKSHNETRVFHNFGSDAVPDWKLVHCHKSPIATPGSLDVLR